MREVGTSVVRAPDRVIERPTGRTELLPARMPSEDCVRAVGHAVGPEPDDDREVPGERVEGGDCGDGPPGVVARDGLLLREGPGELADGRGADERGALAEGEDRGALAEGEDRGALGADLGALGADRAAPPEDRGALAEGLAPPPPPDDRGDEAPR